MTSGEMVTVARNRILKSKRKSENFIHNRNEDFKGVFLYQNNPIMVTYIFAVRELYNIHIYIYKNPKHFYTSLIIIFFLFITNHIFLMLLTCFVIILCFSLSRRFTFLKAKKDKNKPVYFKLEYKTQKNKEKASSLLCN